MQFVNYNRSGPNIVPHCVVALRRRGCCLAVEWISTQCLWLLSSSSGESRWWSRVGNRRPTFAQVQIARTHTHTHMGCVRVLFFANLRKKCVSHQQRQPVSGRLYCKNNSTRHFFSFFFFGGVGLRPMRHGGVPGPMLTAFFFRRDSTPHQRNPAPRGHRANFVWRVVCKCSDKKRSIFLKVDCQLKHARN